MAKNTLIPKKNASGSETSIQIRSNDPTDLVAGISRVWFNTSTQQLKFYDGTTTQILSTTSRIDDGELIELDREKVGTLSGNKWTLSADIYEYNANYVANRNRVGIIIDDSNMKEDVYYRINFLSGVCSGSGSSVSQEAPFYYRVENGDSLKIKESVVIGLIKNNGLVSFTKEKEIKKIGEVWTWGRNTYSFSSGQLGDNTIVNKSAPVKVVNQSDFVAIAGGDNHSLALKSNGEVWAWGSNTDGQLGDNTIVNKSAPVKVVNQSDFVAIAGGSGHSLALKSNGEVWAWGFNFYGQLGNNSTANSSVPVKVLNQSDFVAIAAGDYHSLALKSNGEVWAWGRNTYSFSGGQLGDGTITSKSVPVKVVNQSDFVAIAAGNDHSLALKANGEVWAWGSGGGGRLGNNSTTGSSVPVKVVNQSDFVAIAGGSFHSLALKSNGEVWAWGGNGSGQLGDGTASLTIGKSVPVKVVNQSDFVAIAGGSGHSLALKANGEVWAWGANDSGQLGDNTIVNKSAPVKVVNQSDFVAIAAGDNHSLALKAK